jgi:hypothetical protein
MSVVGWLINMELLVEWELARETEVLGGNITQCFFYPPQIPHNLIWNWDVDNFDQSSGVWKKKIHLSSSTLYPPHFILWKSVKMVFYIYIYIYFKFWTNRKSGGTFPEEQELSFLVEDNSDDISVSLWPQWNLSGRHSTSIVYRITLLYLIDIPPPPTSLDHQCCQCRI